MRQTVVRSALTLIVLALLVSPAAHAQYFGRNKVQYENFNFKVLKTPHFDIYYYDKEKDVVDDIGRMAERWYSRLSRVFNHEFGRKPIVLYANAADFQQTTTTQELIGEGTGGFTDPIQNRVVLPLTGDYAENDHVLGHEMVHVFQFDVANRIANTNGPVRRRFNIEALPLWLIEGMAEYFSKGRVDSLTAMWIRDAAARNKMPDIRKLSRDPRYFPYRYGEALMAYIGGRYGDDSVINYFLAAGEVGVEEGFKRALGVTAKELFADWDASTKELYKPLIGMGNTLGKPLLGTETTRGHLNIGPAYSPDGRYIAFLSTRELFSIDLYVADAHTGHITRRLVSSEGNSHFDALRFIDSAGSWSPDSRKLAFVIFEKGDNKLGIVDVESGRVERIAIPHIDALSNPAWSPDGRTIAFSGQSLGVTDLYTYDLESKAVRQLTNDKYADLEPAWSPDGRTITFASDRGPDTDFTSLRYSNMNIATIDVGGGNVTTLRLFESGKHINPQFSPDGRSIYFIANPEGVSDVFRYDLSSRAITRVTNVATGVSGITDLAPALSVASRTGELAFSVYEHDDHNIYTLPPTPGTQTVSASLGQDVPLAAVLPPKTASQTAASYTTYLERPEEGLPPLSTQFTTTRPDSGLHLTYLGPPTIGVGADRYGFGVGGSVSAYFSDVLGHNNFGFTFQGGGGSGTSLGNSLGGELVYLNQSHRINWGGQATHIPYVSARTVAFRDTVTIDGQEYLADIVQQRRDIQTFDELTALTQYPLSLTRRFEANGGYERIAFKSELETQIIIGNQIVDDHTQKIGNSDAIDLYRGALAFVGDSSTFGFVSPIKGTRYRFEAESLNGDLNFETALADWRKYFFLRPLTLAVRGLHYGRYGKDAENSRISPLYLGQQTLVRGYDIDSFNLSECVQSDPNSTACPAFDRLVGSKIGVASAEIRVPLFGTKEFGLINASAIPTELVGFADAGVAWAKGETPKFRFDQSETTTDRIPVFSVGVAARVLLSYIPIELYYAHPFQRPQQDWVFGFNITPGW